MLPSFFISYSFRDSEAAELLADRLGARGCVVWFAPSNMRAGMPIAAQLDRGLYEADILLVLVSANSATSDWVKREISEFYNLQRQHPERRLCPIRLDSQILRAFEFSDPAVRDWFCAIYAPNFSSWREPESFSAAFDSLARELDALPPSPFDLADRDFPPGSFRTIGREAEFADRLPEALRQRAAAAAAGAPDREATGVEITEAWSRARHDLRQERSADNRAAEASRSRVLTSFLKINHGGVAGLYVSTLARQEIEGYPAPTVAPDLLKALQLYDHYADDDPRAPPQRKKIWWPFGHRKP